jgi:transposase-like protein
MNGVLDVAPFAQKRVLAHEARPMGRPSLYKPEYCEAVIDYMGQGYSLSAFAGHIKVDKTTIYEWMSEHSDFSHAVARARMTRVAALEVKLLRSTKGASTTASIFALRNADPTEWRDVRSVQHDHTVTLQTMTDEQLLAIAQGQGNMIDVTPHKK